MHYESFDKIFDLMRSGLKIGDMQQQNVIFYSNCDHHILMVHGTKGKNACMKSNAFYQSKIPK